VKYCILLTALTLLLAACFGESGTGAPPVDSDAMPDPGAAPEDVMENIEMDLWPTNAVPQQGSKPLLSIRARRFAGSVGSDNEWSFEDAEAVAPAQDDQQTTIRFKAARGVFREEERATLEGGVTAYLDGMTIHLDDFTWEIGAQVGDAPQQGRAYTDNPLRIDSPTQQLEASSMTMNPETAIFELRDVSGEIHFGGIKQ